MSASPPATASMARMMSRRLLWSASELAGESRPSAPEAAGGTPLPRARRSSPAPAPPDACTPRTAPLRSDDGTLLGSAATAVPPEEDESAVGATGFGLAGDGTTGE